MSESELLVRRINDGTVIDHIDEGKGLHVLSAMGIDGKDGGLVTIALNVPSGKYSKKDIIKIEGKFLKTDDTNKLAIIAPKATINIIRGYKLAEKRRVALPDEIGRIFQCTNPDCTTDTASLVCFIRYVLSSWMDSSDFVMDFIDDFTDICKITPYATLKPSDVCCNYCS